MEDPSWLPGVMVALGPAGQGNDEEMAASGRFAQASQWRSADRVGLPVNRSGLAAGSSIFCCIGGRALGEGIAEATQARCCRAIEKLSNR